WVDADARRNGTASRPRTTPPNRMSATRRSPAPRAPVAPVSGSVDRTQRGSDLRKPSPDVRRTPASYGRRAVDRWRPRRLVEGSFAMGIRFGVRRAMALAVVVTSLVLAAPGPSTGLSDSGCTASHMGDTCSGSPFTLEATSVTLTLTANNV